MRARADSSTLWRHAQPGLELNEVREEALVQLLHLTHVPLGSIVVNLVHFPNRVCAHGDLRAP